MNDVSGDGTPGPAREAAPSLLKVLRDIEVTTTDAATRQRCVDARLASTDSGGPRETGDKVSHDGMFDPSEAEACEEWTQAKDAVQAALMFIRHSADTFRDNAREYDKAGEIHEATADFAMAALYDEVAAEGEKGFAALRAELGRAPNDLWMVIRKREIDPVEVWTGDETHMRNIYDRARLNWSETYLVRCIEGPGDVLRARADAERREPAP